MKYNKGIFAKYQILRHSDPERNAKGKNLDANEILRSAVGLPQDDDKDISQHSHKLTKVTAGVLYFLLFGVTACVFADSVSTDTLLKPISAFNSFKVESSMGMASYSIPLEVVPGRKGVQPQVALEYSSNNPNTWLGTGWKLNLGYIQRSLKEGMPNYDSTDNFYIAFRDFRSEVRVNGDGIYWPEYSPSYLKLTFDGLSWKAFDNQGNTYYFGQSEEARVSGVKGVFRWALDKIVDPQSNYIKISYQKFEGQIYPLKIEYTGNEATGDLPTNSMEFILEDRDDHAPNLRYGFNISTTKRLKQIDTKLTGQLVKRYLLEYKYSAFTNRSLLIKVTPYGSDGLTSLPAQIFSYQEKKPDYLFHLDNSSKGNVKWVLRNSKIHPRTGQTLGGILYPDGHFSESNRRVDIVWDYGTVAGNGRWSWWHGSRDNVMGIVRIDAKGKLSEDMDSSSAMYHSTYFYVNAAKTITIPATGNCNARYFLNGDYEHPYDFSTPLSLKAGYNLLEITGYNLTERGVFDLNFSPTDNLDAMNSFQKMLPRISGDFNGDGMSDLGTYMPGGDTRWKVALSKGEEFLPQQNWESVGIFPITDSIPFIGDFNGDGKTDAGYFPTGDDREFTWGFACSMGAGFAGCGSPTSMRPEGGDKNDLPVIGDFNGDGRDEMGYYKGTGDWYIKLDRFKPDNLFITTFGGAGWTAHSGDFNGDGLTDAAVSDLNGNWKVAFSDGSKFVEQGVWITNFGKDKIPITLDYNRDGLCDVGYLDKTQGKIIFRASTGKKFKEQDEEWISGINASGQIDLAFQAGDFNGDGLLDPFIFNPASNYSELGYSQGEFPDLLVKVQNGLGGILSLTYASSVQYDNRKYEFGRQSEKQGLPILIPLVSKSEVSDGLGNLYTLSHSYKGGLYNYQQKEFQGFESVKAVDDQGNSIETHYLQNHDLSYNNSNFHKMKPSLIEKRDSSGKIYEKIENKWGARAFGGYDNRYYGKFSYLSRQEKYAYNEDGSFKKTGITHGYDDYGNLACRTEFTDGNPATDAPFSLSTQYNYNFTSAGSVLGKPAIQAYSSFLCSCSSGCSPLSHSARQPFRWLSYDNSADYNSPPAKGLLTKEILAGNDSYDINSPDNPVITYSYDSYGNLISMTDAWGNRATKTYDTVIHAYPVELINALGHKTTLTYDFRTGQILTLTDANNQTTKNIYDPLGRLIKVLGPNDTDAYPAIIYEYNLSASPVKITTKKKLRNSPASLSYPDYSLMDSFYDGLGRLVQTKSPAEDDPQSNQPRQVVSNTVKYDYRGKVKESYLPYFDNANSNYSTPGPSLKKTVFDYDAPGRLMRTENPDATSSTFSYWDFTVTKTDENGHKLITTFDGRNRLIKKEEFNGGQIYTTAYKYNQLDDLIEIKDNAGNTTAMQYDILHRKTFLSSPDTGTWYYTYDKTGNLKTQKDAKGQVLEFNYDPLNRLTGKQANQLSLATYAYDDTAKPFCKGRLSYILDLSGRADYDYDRLGRQIKVTRTIDGVSYPIERAYNALDQVTSLRYPDGEVVNYAYNKANAIEKISGASTYLSNLDYTASGQILKMDYGNGSSSEYTYDPATLRLTDLSAKTNNGILQDLRYGYDSAGNIKDITDYRNSATQSFLYDDLNRLIRANGSYGSFSYEYDAIGNMIHKEGVNYTYGQSGGKPHAVTSGTDGFSAVYDANGNMTSSNSSVLAYDYDNRLARYEGLFSAQSVTLEIPFSKGWNFVSLPVIVDDPAISAVFSSIAGKYDQVCRYNPTTKKFEYFVLDNPEYSKFTTLEPAKGYQVNLSSECILRITGRIPNTNYSSSLLTGWQMLGYYSKNRVKVSDALANLVKGTNYDRISKYDKAANTFVDLASTDYLEPGASYFIRVLKNSTWTVLPKPDVIDLTEFTYNADGSRVKKIVNGTATVYIDGLYEKTGSAITKHIFAGASRVCSVNTQTSSPANPQTYYYHPDHLGSSNVITNASGAQLQLEEYKPYGSLSRNEPANPQTGSPVHHYFTGKELDSTGLYYYGARYYDPKIGRFITADPITQNLYDPQNLNAYTYVRNNPLRYIDPTGEAFRDSLNNMYSNSRNFWLGDNPNWTTDVFQSSLRETRIWSSAFYTGLNYGANTLVPPGTSIYKTADWLSGNIASPFYNTLTQPGYNYGMWMYGDKSFRNLLGAGLDAAWTISGVAGSIKSIAASGASYWRYIGPESNRTYGSNGQVLTKTWLTKDKYTSMLEANDKLQLPNIPTSVEQVKVPWYRYVGGPREVSGNAQFGAGGGSEFRVGGFESFLKDILSLFGRE